MRSKISAARSSRFRPLGDAGLPRTMRSEVVRGERRGRLSQPHVAPLTDYVCELRARTGHEVPDFDPADGGISASMVFLFEKPGPMTSASKTGRAGSGFISRDNDDPTAEATFRFMEQAGIPRREVVLWNVVPGWNGTRRITRAELAAGVAEVERLLSLLPKVRSIVLVGRKAQRADRLIRATGLPVLHSPHPSPLVRASRPAEWANIPNLWAVAWQSAGA